MNLGCTKWGFILAVYALSGCAIEVVLLADALQGGVSNPDYYHGSNLGYWQKQVEKETKSGKYDPELWAEALVLVEGDKTKRYPTYTVLRAERLEHENEGSESESSPTEPLVFSTKIPGTYIPGIYVSDIQGDPPWMFRDRKPRFTFEQSGNDIIGTDVSKNSSKVIGIRNGDTIKFKYQGAHRLILGKWNINPDGTSLKGTWETNNEHGSWNLTRIE